MSIQCNFDSFTFCLTVFSLFNKLSLSLSFSRVASNVDKILFQRKFHELLLLQLDVLHQKHNPTLPGHLMLFSQEEDKAPLPLPGSVHTHNPRFHDNFFNSKFPQLFFNAHCMSMMNIF